MGRIAVGSSIYERCFLQREIIKHKLHGSFMCRVGSECVDSILFGYSNQCCNQWKEEEVFLAYQPRKLYENVTGHSLMGQMGAL